MSQTNPNSPEKPARETRQWWVVHDGVQRVTGHSCAPNTPGSWWCPEIGYSCSEGHHLFATESEAVDKAIFELEQQLEAKVKQLTTLHLRRLSLAVHPGRRVFLTS